jgi:hypothetical protein
MTARLVLLGFEFWILFRRLGNEDRGLGDGLLAANVRPADELGVGEGSRCTLSCDGLFSVASSSSPMSSKWLASPRTLASSLRRDWKDDDFEPLDAVMPVGVRGTESKLSLTRSRIITAWQSRVAQTVRSGQDKADQV